MASEDVRTLLVLVTLLLVIFVAFFFLLWRPKFAELRDYQLDLSRKETERLQLEQDVKDWPEAFSQETMARYESELEQLWQLVPSEEETAMLLDEIELRARNARLEILALTRVPSPKTTFEVSQPKAKERTQYVAVPYRLSLGGGYFGLVRFLRDLEDSNRLVNVTSIEIFSGRGRYVLSADIQFNIFYSRAEVKAG